MKYQPDIWNSKPLCEVTNCYAYALNSPKVGMGQIGGLAKKVESWLNYSTIENSDFISSLLVKDGLVPIENGLLDPNQHHVIAVCSGIRAEWGEVSFDYHFFRKDGDNSWSQKQGTEEVSRIVIPQEASISDTLFKAYKTPMSRAFFVGFFEVPANGVTALIDQRVNFEENL